MFNWNIFCLVVMDPAAGLSDGSPHVFIVNMVMVMEKISLIVQFKCGQNKLPWTGCVIQACRE